MFFEQISYDESFIDSKETISESNQNSKDEMKKMMNEIKLLKELNLKMHNRLREIEGEIQLLLTNLLVTSLEIL